MLLGSVIRKQSGCALKLFLLTSAFTQSLFFLEQQPFPILRSLKYPGIMFHLRCSHPSLPPAPHPPCSVFSICGKGGSLRGEKAINFGESAFAYFPIIDTQPEVRTKREPPGLDMAGRGLILEPSTNYEWVCHWGCLSPRGGGGVFRVAHALLLGGITPCLLLPGVLQ